MNKVKFKSPSGKVTLVRVTQTHSTINHSTLRRTRTVAETNRYMAQQGFERAGKKS